MTPITRHPPSISGWRGSIRAPQAVQRPRLAIQLTSGTNCQARSLRPQPSHVDRPRSTDRPSGQRTVIVARKLPMIAPASPSNGAKNGRVGGTYPIIPRP